MNYFPTYEKAKTVLESIIPDIFNEFVSINSIGIRKDKAGYIFELGCPKGEDCTLYLSEIKKKSCHSGITYEKLPLTFQTKNLIDEKLSKSVVIENEITNIQPGKSISLLNSGGMIGTISAILEDDESQKYAMTCSHIIDPLLNDEEEEKETKQLPLDVCSPGVNLWSRKKRVIGQLVPNFTSHLLDISLCKINNQFYDIIDFSVAHFNTRLRCSDEFSHGNEVAKFGYNTKHTVGTIAVTDLYLRDMYNFPFIQVDSKTEDTLFVDVEDSGSSLVSIEPDHTSYSKLLGILSRRLITEINGKKYFSGLAIPIKFINDFIKSKNQNLKIK